MAFFKEELTKVRAFAFDVDGVLARGEVILHPGGDLMRTMHTKDGFAIRYALQKGYPVAIISGARSESIRDRMKTLGGGDIYLDSRNKWKDLKHFIDLHGLTTRDLLYMGDDLPDLEVMQRVAVPTCPNDAVTEIQSVSKYISPFPGGQGCVRDVIEQVLRAHGNWPVI